MVDFRRFSTLILLVVLALGAGGCVHNNPNLTPAQNTQLNLYSTLDLITTANRDVTKAVISLNAAGTVSTPVTRAVLDYAQQVNDASRAALAVLDSSQTPQQKATAVLAALKKLDLPPPVKEFVNSNPNVAAVVSVVNSIVAIQQAIAQAAATPPALLGTAKPTGMVVKVGEN